MDNNSTPLSRKILAGCTLAYAIINGFIPLLITLVRWSSDIQFTGPTLFGVLLLIFTLGALHGLCGIGVLWSKQSVTQVGEACLFSSIPLAMGTTGLLTLSGVQPGTFDVFGQSWTGWVAVTGLIWAIVYRVVRSRLPSRM